MSLRFVGLPMPRAAICFILLHLWVHLIPKASAAPNLKRLIVTYSSGARSAAGESWRSALAPLQVAMVHHSLSDRVAVLEGTPEQVAAAAASLTGVVRVEEDVILRAQVMQFS